MYFQRTMVCIAFWNIEANKFLTISICEQHVIGDKIWLYYCNVVTKSKNKVLVFEHKDIPIPVKKSQSGKKCKTGGDM